MISWFLFIFVAYGPNPVPPIVIENFSSYDACQIAGEQITSNFKTLSFKCVKVEK